MKKIHVWLSKEEIDPLLLSNATAVILDVLLATTTMITMMEQGARRVFPASDLQEVTRIAESIPDANWIFGGEEDGQLIPNFHCGPFPQEYSREQVKGKDVIFLTTNGTRAIRKAQSARELLIASLRNAPAVAEYLRTSESERIFLICAGSKGHLSLEDTLCAGYILTLLGVEESSLNDAAIVARDMVIQHNKWPLDWLKESRVGRWFTREGKESVLEFVGDVGASQAIVKVKNGRLYSNLTSADEGSQEDEF